MLFLRRALALVSVITAVGFFGLGARSVAPGQEAAFFILLAFFTVNAVGLWSAR